MPGVDAHEKRLVEVHVGAEPPHGRGLDAQERELERQKEPRLLAGEQRRVVASAVEDEVPKVHFSARLHRGAPAEEHERPAQQDGKERVASEGKHVEDCEQPWKHAPSPQRGAQREPRVGEPHHCGKHAEAQRAHGMPLAAHMLSGFVHDSLLAVLVDARPNRQHAEAQEESHVEQHHVPNELKGLVLHHPQGHLAKLAQIKRAKVHWDVPLEVVHAHDHGQDAEQHAGARQG
mmetsp:Transcript_38632/g.77922  ORF Transcript_38632/g.77922 Transcript_38632/m.77922 type:complete len:233 (-) Transcript_38632:723-1421(-)